MSKFLGLLLMAPSRPSRCSIRPWNLAHLAAGTVYHLALAEALARQFVARVT